MDASACTPGQPCAGLLVLRNRGKGRSNTGKDGATLSEAAFSYQSLCLTCGDLLERTLWANHHPHHDLQPVPWMVVLPLAPSPQLTQAVSTSGNQHSTWQLLARQYLCVLLQKWAGWC